MQWLYTITESNNYTFFIGLLNNSAAKAISYKNNCAILIVNVYFNIKLNLCL